MLAKRTPGAPGPGWAGILVLVTAALLVVGVPSVGAAESWLVREQPGTLQYRLPESADWSPASPGLELQPGTTVRAGSGRPAVLTQEQSRIVIRAGTELILPIMDSGTVVQRRGSVRYQVKPRSVADFLVETPYLVIGIKGTTFDVMVSEAGAEVQVSEGLVEVTTPDGRFRAILARGQSARIGAAAGSVLEVDSGSGGAGAPVPADSSSSDEASRSNEASSSTETVIGGVLSPLTSTARSLWSGVGELLSDVDVVYDDRLPTRRTGTVVRALRGGLATVGSGAPGDSGGGHSNGSSSSGGGDAGSSGGGGNSASGSSGGGLGGGGLGGAVGSVGGALGNR